MKQTLGIIGYGNMGQAIAWRLKKKFSVLVFDKDFSKTESLVKMRAALTSAELAAQSDIIILAVKPQDFETVLSEIKDSAGDKLVISIAAGIRTEYVEKQLPVARVVRVMPNLPAVIGKGMICIAAGAFTEASDVTFTKRLFEELGRVLVIDESMMNAATAVSGSGPGFFYYLIEGKNKKELKRFIKDVFISELGRAAEEAGFTVKEAKILAQETAEGSADFLEKSGISSQELMSRVASRGGTTEAGLLVLRRGGTLSQAVAAALQRAQELSKKE